MSLVTKPLGQPEDGITLDQVGAATHKAAKGAARKFRGRLPEGMDREDIVQEICVHALPKVVRWRRGGPKSFANYTRCACAQALSDFIREHARHVVGPKEPLGLHDTVRTGDRGLEVPLTERGEVVRLISDPRGEEDAA